MQREEKTPNCPHFEMKRTTTSLIKDYVHSIDNHSCVFQKILNDFTKEFGTIRFIPSKNLFKKKN
jgi:hypothetical protein